MSIYHIVALIFTLIAPFYFVGVLSYYPKPASFFARYPDLYFLKNPGLFAFAIVGFILCASVATFFWLVG